MSVRVPHFYILRLGLFEVLSFVRRQSCLLPAIDSAIGMLCDAKSSGGDYETMTTSDIQPLSLLPAPTTMSGFGFHVS